MKIVKNIVIALVVLVAALFLIGFLLPKSYKVERSTSIQAPIDLVFDQVNDLKKNEAWSPWKEEGMVVTYGPITAGKGASSSWTAKRMGNGSQTITESTPSTSIENHLDFGPQGTAEVKWTFAQEGDAVKVTQTMTGEQTSPLKRYFSLVMDKMVGKYFEQGMASLKQVSETKFAEMKAQEAATQQAAAAPAEEGAAPAAGATAPATPAAPTAPAAPAKAP